MASCENFTGIVTHPRMRPSDFCKPGGTEVTLTAWLSQEATKLPFHKFVKVAKKCGASVKVTKNKCTELTIKGRFTSLPSVRSAATKFAREVKDGLNIPMTIQ